MCGLSAERALVDGVADEAEGEDCGGEAVATVEGVAAGELGEGFVVVFAAGGEVPEGGVEEDAGDGDYGDD